MKAGELAGQGAQFDVKHTSVRHSLYPARLLAGMGEKAPRRIYYRGRLELLEEVCIGVLTSRSIPEDGIPLVRRFVAGFADGVGRTLLSGWTSPAERSALEAAAREAGNIAIFLDHSLDGFRRTPLLDGHIRAGRLLVASHCRMTNMRRSRPAAFQRNRIVAALSHVLLAPCAPARSGTLKVATEALEQGAVVITIDWPQNAELIRRGALVCGSTKPPAG